MEASSSRSLGYDDETRVLEVLFDIFGSTNSLTEIANAFCKAGRNPDLAAEILSESQGCTFESELVSEKLSKDLVLSDWDSKDLVLSDGESKDSVHSDRDLKVSKPKIHGVSVGTVSSVLGKGYSRPPTLLNGVLKSTKPLKINLKELPKDMVKGKDVLDSTTGKESMHNDVEDFLFKMLGNGFQLGKDVIRNVLGSCGYDVNETIEELIDLSASTLKKSDDIVDGFSEKFADEDPELGHPLCKTKSGRTGILKRNQKEPVNRERYELQKEVLTSLFTVPERIEEVPRRTRPVRAVKQKRAFGSVVREPLSDTTPEYLTNTVDPQEDMAYDVEDESYRILRRAAKEHWITMKEYYKAAVQAFATGNHSQAEELLQQGQHFNNKAREADEKSAQQILECRNKDNKNHVDLDLHTVDAKMSIRLLKLNLTNLSGIADMQYLKVIVETDDDDDTTKGARKKWVLKLLQRENIAWTEEANGNTIVIRLDEIDREKLSFAKKS